MAISTFKTNTDARGFTLIELIVFLLLASVVGTALYTYSDSSRHGVKPAMMLQNRLDLQAAMETILINYKQQIQAGTLDLTTFQQIAETASIPDVSGVTISATLTYGLIQEDDPKMLEITVSKGGQHLWALFTE